MKKQTIIFDTEIIGSENPVFLVCVKIIETGETHSFWHHKKGDVTKFFDLLDRKDLVWISFNGIAFDAPLIAAWINGRPVSTIKLMAEKIINQRMMPWEAYAMAGMDGLKFDHIDIKEVAPGVMVSLKTYAGRMHYPSMVDLPFHHDKDLTPKERKVLEAYCRNDLGVTEALYEQLKEGLALREQLGATYNLDLRSKSGPQVSEAILKKVVGLGKATKVKPSSITFTLPPIIKLKNKALIALAARFEDETFYIDDSGAPQLPDWMADPLELHGGLYKFGIGGLHSQHDKQLYVEADDEYEISDIDAEGYYPNTIVKCGFIPKLQGKGDKWVAAYKSILDQRAEAKHTGQKAIASTLKLAGNGAYGKLGSLFCSFYAPDLMLATCLTGQLNLLNLVDLISKIKGVSVLSANTDGIMVRFPKAKRDELFKAVAQNERQTGFKYEETRYLKAAMKDVNNYIAVKLNGEVKDKGLYGPTGLEKNPTARVCSLAAAEFLKKGVKPETFIKRQKKIELFVTIRGINDGGVQHTHTVPVDDWVEAQQGRMWYRPCWPEDRAYVKRVSRPKPVDVGAGGKPFGRVARWYMSTKKQPPITNALNGNKVPKTDGAQLCMTLPSVLPTDLNRQWYVTETYTMLSDMGVKL